MLLIVFHQQDRQPGCTAIVIMDYCTGQAISHCVYVMRRVHRCVFSICVAQKFNAQDKQLARSSRSVVQRVAWSPWKLSQCQWLPLRLLLGWAAATLIATLCAAAYDYPLPASSCCSRYMHAKHAQQHQVDCGHAPGHGAGATTFFRTVVFALCGKFTAWHIKQASGDMIGFMSACRFLAPRTA